MTRVPLQRNPKLYEDFYCNQAGHGMPVFIGGGRNQRGRGLGSFFGGLGRMILPMLKTGGKALLREGVGTGLQLAQDALAGRNLSESFKEHGKAAGQRLLQGAVSHIIGNQSGSGLRRPAPPGEPAAKRIKTVVRTKGSHSSHNQKKKKKQTRKRSQAKKYSDIFG